MLGDIRHDIGLVGRLADRLATPDMFGPPVPAFPAVRVAGLPGIAAHHGKEPPATAVGGMDHLGLAVSVSLHENGRRPVFLLDSLNFTGDDIGGLIPGDSYILALAPVLGIPLAFGVP